MRTDERRARWKHAVATYAAHCTCRTCETLLEVGTVGTTISYPARCTCRCRGDCSDRMKPRTKMRLHTKDRAELRVYGAHPLEPPHGGRVLVSIRLISGTIILRNIPISRIGIQNIQCAIQNSTGNNKKKMKIERYPALRN